MVSRRLVDLFLELARIDALPGKEAALASYVFTFLRNMGLQPQVDGTAAATLSNTGNVVCPVGGGGAFALLAHMDTASYTSGNTPVVSADRVSSDGKGQLGVERAGLAAVLYSLERAVNTSLPMKPFTLAFTTRSRPAMAGARHLALPAGIRCGFVFTSASAPGSYTVSSHGVANFSADVLGRSADGGQPEQGVCAVTIAAKALAGLQFGRHDADTTSNIGTIAGGSGPGTIPLAALVRGQVRAAQEEKAGPVLDRIKAGFETAAKAGGGAVAFKWSWEFAPYAHQPGAEVRRLAEEALIAAALKPSPEPAATGSEANLLSGRGIPTVNFGVGIKNLQTNNEYIQLDHLSKTFEIIWQLIKK